MTDVSDGAVGAEGLIGKRIVVFGAGAVGSYVGGYLSYAGCDVTLVDGWAAHVEAVRSNGLELSGRSDAEQLVARPAAQHLNEITGIARQKPIDVALLAVKSYDTEWMTMLARDLLAPSGYVVSLQNAMNEERIAAIVGWGRTVGCIASSISVELHAPGKVRRQALRGNADVFRVGEVHGRVTERVRTLSSALSVIDRARVTTNLWGERWSKLAHNAMRNGIAAATGFSSREIDENAELRRFSIEVGAEAVRVGLALGFELEAIGKHQPDDLLRASAGDRAAFERVDGAILGRSASGATGALQRASMGQDIAKGRRTEIGDINGLVVRKGAEAGIATPANARLVWVVQAVERGLTAPGLAALFADDAAEIAAR